MSFLMGGTKPPSGSLTKRVSTQETPDSQELGNGKPWPPLFAR